MKKLISIVIALAIALMMLAGCGNSKDPAQSSKQDSLVEPIAEPTSESKEGAEPTEEPADPEANNNKTASSESDPSQEPVAVEDFTTIGAVLKNKDKGFGQYAIYDHLFVYAFEFDNKAYRAIADLSDEEYEQFSKINIRDDGFQDKFNEFISTLEITKMESLNEFIVPREELDSLVGKTGKELLDSGWVISGHNLEEMQVLMDYNMFSYVVFFDNEYENPDEIPEDFDTESFVRDHVINDIQLDGMGDATNIEIEAPEVEA